MFNLNDILLSAQNGQIASNLAQHYGISALQAQNLLSASIPPLAHTMQLQSQSLNNLALMAAQMLQPIHQTTYQTFNATPRAPTFGNDILQQLFGAAILPQIVAQLSRQTGLAPELVQQMLPVIASAAMGGLYAALQQQGLNNWLNYLQTLSKSASPVPSFTSSPGSPDAPGAMSQSMVEKMNSFFNSFTGAPIQQPQPKPKPDVHPDTPPTGAELFSNMIQPGTEFAQAHFAAWENIFNQISATNKK